MQILKNRAFSIIEILLVIVIIAIFAIFALPQIAKWQEGREVRAEVKTEIKHHMDKLPQESPWGTFWRSEYDEIANEKSSN